MNRKKQKVGKGFYYTLNKDYGKFYTMNSNVYGHFSMYLSEYDDNDLIHYFKGNGQFVGDLGKLKIGENVPEMFSADLGLEMTNQSCLKVAINVCEDNNDYVTRDIFLKILDDTEEHIDWIESQQHVIEHAGLKNFLQEQIAE